MCIDYYYFCGDDSLAGFNVEEGNDVGLKEMFGAGCIDRIDKEEGTVVGFNEGHVVGSLGGLEEKQVLNSDLIKDSQFRLEEGDIHCQWRIG